MSTRTGTHPRFLLTRRNESHPQIPVLQEYPARETEPGLVDIGLEEEQMAGEYGEKGEESDCVQILEIDDLSIHVLCGEGVN